MLRRENKKSNYNKLIIYVRVHKEIIHYFNSGWFEKCCLLRVCTLCHTYMYCTHVVCVRKVLCSAANVLSRDSAPTTPAGGTIPPSKACKSWCTKGKFKPEQYCKFVACEACPKLKYYTFCIYIYICTCIYVHMMYVVLVVLKVKNSWR
mgnify:CR=1 FL=1